MQHVRFLRDQVPVRLDLRDRRERARAHRHHVAGLQRRHLRVDACCRVLALDVPGVGDEPFNPVVGVEPGAADPHLQQPRPHLLRWRVDRDRARALHARVWGAVVAGQRLCLGPTLSPTRIKHS